MENKFCFDCNCSYAGNLHFASLSTDDAQTNKVYKCNVLNPYLDLTIGGSYTRLHVTSSMYMSTAWMFNSVCCLTL